MSVLAFGALPEVHRQALARHFDVRDFTGLSGLRRRPEFMAALSTVAGVIGSGMPFDRTLIEAAHALKVISSVSVGYDNYDLEALNARRILLCNTPDVLTESVADLAMALMLGVARRMVEMAEMVRSGDWVRSIESSRFGTDVHGARVGIVGMGRIGEAIARRARLGFGMDVLYHSRSRKPQVEERFGARFATLDQVLAESDFVCVVLPLSRETEGMFGAREFRAMKPSAYFINVSRGAVVDEGALVTALDGGWIAGAGLDVYAREPLPRESPLRSSPHVLALPHIGSATRSTRDAMATLAVENLIAGLTGCRPKAVVNPEILS